MSGPRFALPDLPADRPKVPDVMPLVRAYFAKPGNGAGGNLHVALDDGNLDNGSLQFCLSECEREHDYDGATIMRLMLQMTRTQRRHICEKVY